MATRDTKTNRLVVLSLRRGSVTEQKFLADAEEHNMLHRLGEFASLRFHEFYRTRDLPNPPVEEDNPPSSAGGLGRGVDATSLRASRPPERKTKAVKAPVAKVAAPVAEIIATASNIDASSFDTWLQNEDDD